MWRYLAGGIGALLMVAAGWLLFSGKARTDPILPPQPRAAVQTVDEGGAEPPVPEASARTREEKRFDRNDKDRDGKITRDEYLMPRRKAFAKLDADGDGRLTFEEWAVKTMAKFAGADRDKSGAMDRDEFATTKVKRKASLKAKCICPAASSTDEAE